MRSAGAYEFRNDVYVHAFSQTTAGVWILSEPVFRISSANPEEVGSNTLEALQASKTGVPHPTTWNDGFDEVLSLAGVRSYSTFAKTARSVDIYLKGDTVTLTPSKNEGPRHGYSQLTEKSLYARPDNLELGVAMMKAFSLCE